MTTDIPATFVSRVRDLLHILSFAQISTPTPTDAHQALFIVEELQSMLAAAPTPPVDAVPGEPEIWRDEAKKALLADVIGRIDGRKLAAIRICRAATGFSLKLAREAVEEIQRELQAPQAVGEPVAWCYAVGAAVHLMLERRDHFFSIDGGETFIKGEPLYAAPVAPRADEEPMAWADGEGRVLSAAQMENARNHQGEPGKIVAAQYSTPLYPPRAGEESKTYRDFLAFDDHESTPPAPAKREETLTRQLIDAAFGKLESEWWSKPDLFAEGARFATPAPTATAEPSEREAFEAHIRKDCGDLRTFGRGQHLHYLNSAVNNAWGGWMARATLKAAPGSAADAFWNGTLLDRNKPE
jgi:ribosomal protein L7/L12